MELLEEAASGTQHQGWTNYCTGIKAMPGGRPPLYSDPDEMQVLIDAYFERCETRDKPLTMGGLAYALGMDRDTLLKYEKKDQFVGLIKRARDRVRLDVEERLLGSKGQVAGPIFWLKNNGAWVDKQEIREESDTRLTITWDQGSKPAPKPD